MNTAPSKPRQAKIRSMITRVTLATLLGGGAVMVAATPAQAYPQDCSAGTWVFGTGSSVTYGGWSYCSYGSGSHRVVVDCDNHQTGSTYLTRGPWVGTGSQSSKACFSGYTATWAGVERQGD